MSGELETYHVTCGGLADSFIVMATSENEAVQQAERMLQSFDEDAADRWFVDEMASSDDGWAR